MKNAFIFHGAYGNPQENWFPWLAKELENRGDKVIVPQFPTPEGQSLKTWMEVFQQYEKEVNEETIFIAHSIAVAFVLRILETLDRPIKAAFLVAGFIQGLGNEIDKINDSFYDKPFDFEKIKKNCKQFYCFNSITDPYVPLWQGEEVAENLSTKMIVVENAGHFNTKAGYTTFPLLLDKIQQL